MQAYPLRVFIDFRLQQLLQADIEQMGLFQVAFAPKVYLHEIIDLELGVENRQLRAYVRIMG